MHVVRSESETGDEVGYCSRRRSRRLVLLLAKCRVLAAPGASPALAAPRAFRRASDPAQGSRGIWPNGSFRCHRATSAAGSTWLGDAASYGVGGCLDAVLEVKLGEGDDDVVRDCVRAQGEVSRDLVVAFAAGESLEDLELAV